MSNTPGVKRSLKMGVVEPRLIAVKVTGTAGTPAASEFGSPSYQIKQVVDLGTGNYTLIFNLPFERECALLSWTSMTADVVECVVTAVAYDRITIQLNDVAGAPIDGDVFLSILGSQGRYNVGR